MARNLSLGFFALLVSVASANAACHDHAAPYKFLNEPLEWGKDSGPIVNEGFVDSQRPKGGIYQVAHGVDVSKGDGVNYSKLAECGGTFAVVRINHSITKKGQIAGPIDEEFSSHMRNFTRHNIIGIPYFFFSLPTSFKQLNKLNKRFSASELDAKKEEYANFGREAGKLFIQYVEELSKAPDLIPIQRIPIAGLRAKFIALDVEEVPIGKSTDVSARNYGKLYAAAVCQWIKTVRDRYPDLVPLLYTFPAIYGEYLQYALPADNACLQGLPVWISRTYWNGWEAIRDIDATDCDKKPVTCVTDRYVKLTCNVGRAGNRCIVHQYTHRGTAFALGRKAKYPPHFQLDRFYEARESRTNSTPQYVRVQGW
jgi:hypothetical protein